MSSNTVSANDSASGALPPTFAPEDTRRAELIQHVGTVLRRVEQDDEEVDFEYLVKVFTLHHS